MRKLLVLAIAACSSPGAPPPPPPAAPPPARIDPWNAQAASIPRDLAGLSPWLAKLAPHAHPTHSVHGTAIARLAATEDGTVAVTADRDSAVRLWPALDGTQEPVVVAMNPPVALAVAHDGADLAIAGLDAAGRLELVRTTATGEALERTVVDSPRPFKLIRALAGGVLAVRDDQRVDRFDAHGRALGSLTPDPGERIGAIAARHGRALALVASSEGVRGRWLELAAGLVWGGATAKLAIDPDGAELSPDHRHVMAMYPPLQSTALIDLDTGRVYAIPWERPEFKEPMRPVGFIAAAQLALASTFGNGILWWQDDATTRGYSGADERDPTGPSVAVDGRVIVAFREQLVLHTPEATKYLGYGRINLQQVRGTRDGWLGVGYGRSEILELDAKLRDRRRVETPPETDSLVLVDDYHALALRHVERARAHDLYLLDFAHPDADAVAWQTGGYVATYEPSTHLVATSEEHEIRFARVDRKTGAIGEPISFPIDGRPYAHQVYLLDPARAKGNVALVIDNDYASQTLTVSEIRSIDRDEVAVARTYSVDNSKPNAHDQVMRAHGLTADGRPASRTSPGGNWVAQADGYRLTLRGKDGKLRWTVDAHGAIDVAWRPNGELAAVGIGVALVDLETGAFGERRCGWRFQLADAPLADSSLFGGRVLCD